MKKVKVIFAVLMMVIFLGIGSTSAFSLDIGSFIRSLIGYCYRPTLASCPALVRDKDGNIIEAQGARVDCLQGDASCTAISCQALQP